MLSFFHLHPGLLVFMFYYNIYIVVASFALGFPDFYGPYFGLVDVIAYIVFIYFIAIKGKLTPKIRQVRQLPDKTMIPAHLPTNVRKKEIADEKKELILLSEQVLKTIEEEKLYKEMGLTINELADKSGSQPYLVSQAINSCLRQNFFELINRYRVQEAKRLLKDESMIHFSIVRIGFEAGFNSKTAFNTSFKKYAGLTPSKFKKSEVRKPII